MSNALAIAGVTRTLRLLLDAVATADYSGLPDDTRPTAEIRVTTLPLDSVRGDDGDTARNQLNLFLYHTEVNASWRNQRVPGRVRPGETGPPPLALNLYYLLTAYGQDDSELIAHVLLGTAMRLLHDHPLLGREEIRTALSMSDLADQMERVRLTLQPISLDEVSKLWTGFQSEYRLSVAYQVSLVLIESHRESVAPLPVLRRGEADRGPVAVAAPGASLQAVTGFEDPTLAVQLDAGKPSAELGDVLVLSGRHLDTAPLTARFRHPRLAAPIERPVEPGPTATEVRVALPGAGDAGVPEAWPPGFYTVELIQQPPGLPQWTTNRIPFALSPTLDSLTPTTQAVGAQPFDLTLTGRPQIRDDQSVSVLFGARELVPSSVSTPAADSDAATTVVVPVDGVDAGTYVVRLRVDGADSVPIDVAATPPEFDTDQIVTMTP